MKKDPFEKERAEAKLRRLGKEVNKNSAVEQFFGTLMQNSKGEAGYTPQKGKDYFTPSEKTEFRNDILALIPKPKDGKDADYDLVFEYVVQEVEKAVQDKVSKLPKPKDGKPGKDAVVDIPAIVESLLKVMPKMEKVSVDYLGIKEYVDKQVSKIKVQPPLMRNGGTNSLRQLTDVVLTGLTQDEQGNYILGGGSSLPDQTGNNGKFLGTDGTDATWESIPGGGDMLGSNNLSDVANAGTSRTNLGLGTAATQATGAFATAAQGLLADSAQQPPSEGAFVDGDKTKLNGIASGAEVNVQANWTATSGDAFIANKPSLATVATTGDYDDLSNKPDLSAFDNISEHANVGAFPGTGAADKFYLAQDTGILYRWTGSAYAIISAQLALGETSSTAYRGDRGKTAFDHVSAIDNPHSVTKAQVGLSNVPNTDFTSAVDANTAKVSYTDATKVAGIEAGAQVTNTTRVTAAGALMDSEVTNLAQVKAFDSADYATSAQGTTADNAAPRANPTFTGEIGIGAVNVSETELGILEGATVTTAELNYVDGVTSSVQTQLDAKLTATDYDDATAAEVNTGTSTAKYTSPDALAGSYAGTKSVQVDIFGELATGDSQAKVIIPSDVNGMDLVAIEAHVGIVGTTGTTDVQVRNATDSVDVLSTKLTIDSGETSSTTAATAPVINSSNDSAATSDVWYIDIDAVSSTAPEDISIVLTYRLP